MHLSPRTEHVSSYKHISKAIVTSWSCLFFLKLTKLLPVLWFSNFLTQFSFSKQNCRLSNLVRVPSEAYLLFSPFPLARTLNLYEYCEKSPCQLSGKECKSVVKATFTLAQVFLVVVFFFQLVDPHQISPLAFGALSRLNSTSYLRAPFTLAQHSFTLLEVFLSTRKLEGFFRAWATQIDNARSNRQTKAVLENMVTTFN